MFISLHRYDDGLFYPAHSDSNYDCVGEAKGRGFTVNIPWNQIQAGDAEYLAAFLRIVMPVAYQVNKTKFPFKSPPYSNLFLCSLLSSIPIWS